MLVLERRQERVRVDDSTQLVEPVRIDVDPVHDLTVPSDRRLDRRFPLAVLSLEHADVVLDEELVVREENLGLGREMREQGARPDIGSLGDLAQSGLVEPPLDEELASRLHDRSTSLPLPALTPA